MSLMALKSLSSNNSMASRPIWGAHQTTAKYQVNTAESVKTNIIRAGVELYYLFRCNANMIYSIHDLLTIYLFILLLCKLGSGYNTRSTCDYARARRRRILGSCSDVASVSAVVRSCCSRNNCTARGHPARTLGNEHICSSSAIVIRLLTPITVHTV